MDHNGEASGTAVRTGQSRAPHDYDHEADKARSPEYRAKLRLRVRADLLRQTGFAFLRQCGEGDLANRRGFLWLAVLYLLGMAIYFVLPAEPSLVALGLAGVLATGVVIKTARGGQVFGFRLACVIAAVMTGMAIAKVRTEWVAQPHLSRAAVDVNLQGIVQRVEVRPQDRRLTLGLINVSGYDRTRLPDSVRVTTRSASPPLRVGDLVRARARLMRARGSAIAGGYDFAFDAYYRRMPVNGFVYGAVRLMPPGTPAPDVTGLQKLRQDVAMWRETVEARIRQALVGEAGAFAAALVTGNRSGLSPATVDALRQSGLAHVLAISGMHMALVAGTALLLARMGLALFPGLVARYPTRKWAAALALCVGAAYLLLSGASVATVRAFIMFAVALMAIMADRLAITMRNVAIAAIAVGTMGAEAVLQPGFQMSFAAVVALVAAYEAQRRRNWALQTRSGSLASALRLGRRYVGGLILTALVAGVATMPFVAFYFHRIAGYGLLANVLAMPIVGFVVMPAGLVGMLLMPFGLEVLAFQVMGLGLEWVVRIATWVSGLEGAVVTIGAIKPVALVFIVAGGLWIALWLQTWRWFGLVFFALALFVQPLRPKPDILIADNGRQFAVRLADGLLHLSGRRNRFAAAIWLRADGDGRALNDGSLRAGVTCTRAQCQAPLPSGGVIVLARRADALNSACTFARIIVTPLRAPRSCGAALIFDKERLGKTGAVSLYRDDSMGTWQVKTALGGARPWHPQTDRHETRDNMMGLSVNRHHRPANKRFLTTGPAS